MNLQPSHVVIKGSEITPVLRAEILALCTRAYQVDFEVFYHTFIDPTHVLAYLDGQLVSHALWVERWLQPQDLPALRTAYVEAVATEPEYQGRGLASGLLRFLATQIQAYDLGGLSPSAASFYERLGWESWRGLLYIRAETGLMLTPEEEVMILRLPRTPSLDLDTSLSAEWREGELW